MFNIKNFDSLLKNVLLLYIFDILVPIQVLFAIIILYNINSVVFSYKK